MNLRIRGNLVKFLSYFLLFFSFYLEARLSTLANNDPFPAYSTTASNDFLYNYHTNYLKGAVGYDEDRRLSFAVSPFLQKAKFGSDCAKKRSEIGDIRGKWGMVGLLYGDIPCGEERGEALNKAFRCAQFCGGVKFCGNEVEVPDPSFTSTRFMHDPQFSDTTQHFGFFSVPLIYRKVGVRFEATGLLARDIGLNLVFGVADITQCTTGMVDLSHSLTRGGPDNIFGSSKSQNELDIYITQRMNQLFKEIGLDVSEFHESSVEDLQVALFWRHAYAINKKKEKNSRNLFSKNQYQEFLFIPFLTVDGSLGLGKAKNPAKAFSLPFGNNSHHAIGFSAGFNIDFFEMVEIGISGGGTNFFKREFHNIFVPTHELQSVVFPFKTDVCVQPGNNWHFTALMNAYHFLENVSFHAQYVFVTHNMDTISLLRPNKGTRIELIQGGCPVEAEGDIVSPCSCLFSGDSGAPAPEDVDNVFKPGRLQQDSSWSSQLLDVALNVDIASQASLGILWQIPIKQRNAYRSNTFMVSFEARF